jgi:hypothetical protein
VDGIALTRPPERGSPSFGKWETARLEFAVQLAVTVALNLRVTNLPGDQRPDEQPAMVDRRDTHGSLPATGRNRLHLHPRVVADANPLQQALIPASVHPRLIPPLTGTEGSQWLATDTRYVSVSSAPVTWD